MYFKKVLISCLLAVVGMTYSIAGNVNVDAARVAAGKFLQSHRTTFKSSSTSHLVLAHTEASSVEGNAYYVFNIDGGGWVIIAGDDRAKQILAYGDKGNIDMNDMNNMPGGMMGFLKMYKEQIETLQAYEGKLVPIKSVTRSTVVNPLLKTDWDQGEPFNRLCPLNSAGDRTSVGCGPLAMAQICYYWKYPSEVSQIEGYSISWSQSMSALPATTFDYDLMLDNYFTHNPETGNPTGYVAFTEEQANEIAKLSRYCGQACKTKYGDGESGTASGSYTYDQRDAFFTFGFNSGAQLIGKDPSYYCANYPTKYTDDEWAALICTELEAGRPIPYHDMWEGHAWVLDGVDAEGKFHMNWGFAGRFNGWYEMNAMTFHPYNNDEVWDFSHGSNGYNEMIIGMYPYEGYVIPGDEPTGLRGDVDGDGKVDITDATMLINYLLSNDPTGINMENANCDLSDDGKVDITDATTLINYLLNNAW